MRTELRFPKRKYLLFPYETRMLERDFYIAVNEQRDMMPSLYQNTKIVIGRVLELYQRTSNLDDSISMTPRDERDNLSSPVILDGWKCIEEEED